MKSCWRESQSWTLLPMIKWKLYSKFSTLTLFKTMSTPTKRIKVRWRPTKGKFHLKFCYFLFNNSKKMGGIFMKVYEGSREMMSHEIRCIFHDKNNMHVLESFFVYRIKLSTFCNLHTSAIGTRQEMKFHFPIPLILKIAKRHFILVLSVLMS